MTPEDRLRALRDDSRWVNVPASGPPSAPRTPLIATLLALLLVIAGSVAVVTSTDPRRTQPAQSTTSTTAPPTPLPKGYHPKPVPPSDGLTSAQLGCGARVPSSVFTTAFNGVDLRTREGGVQFQLSNFAAAGPHVTTVSARLAVSTPRGVPLAEYGSAMKIALVQGNQVVAVSPQSGPDDVGRRLDRSFGTALLSVPFAAERCDGGAALPDGTYSVIAFGARVTVGTETIHLADARPGVHLRNGVLDSGYRSASDGPWRGTGVPTCGTSVSLPSLRAFAAREGAAARTAGLVVRITGFEPHANAEGWDFRVEITNASPRAIRMPRGWTSTAVVRGGRIVSAPDSIPIGPPFTGRAGAYPPKTLLPGASLIVDADAPRAGCGLDSSYVTPYPSLGPGMHTAYIDLGVTAQNGADLVLVQDYDFQGERGRPRLRP